MRLSNCFLAVSLAALNLSLLLAGCGTTGGSAAAEPYRAEILRSGYGVAHITAADYGSLGYGEGYAAGEDHVCNIALSLLEARGELAGQLGAGEDNEHLLSDVVVAAMGIEAQAREALDMQDPEMREWLEGYAAGYNRFLADRGPSPTSWCAGADWVRPTTALDFMAHMVLLTQTLPRLAAAVVSAQPPSAAPVSAVETVSEALLARAPDAVDLVGMGSNAWALGSERTENGRGLLLANPHYPWYGANRFWEKHLTIPDKLDVYGASLVGAPGVAIGFNRAVAWSHTVSDSERVVFYRLQLVPGDPTHYLYDGEVRELHAETVSVPVRQDDGSLRTVERSVWFSHYGPMLQLPGMNWSDTVAYTARDANVGNYFTLAQWKAMDEASDLDRFIEAHRRWNAMPWVNTMAASADGRALYLDNSTVGDLSDEAIGLWRESLEDDALAAGVYARRGWILLDGSDSRFEWRDNNVAPLPGTVPFERRPRLERRDYIFNSNDSYWLTNPEVPMDGYSPLYGSVETARSLRTRMNLRMLAPNSAYDYAGDDERFSSREIQQALFDNRGLAAELLLGELVSTCREAPQVAVDGEIVELSAACEALQAYDGRLNEESSGAVLFREWLAQYDYEETLRAGTLFAQPFDPRSPAATPQVLGDRSVALRHLATAVQILEAAGLPVDASLGAAQFAYRAGARIPVHGGNRYEGVANMQISGPPSHPVAGVTAQPVANSRLLTSAGYPVLQGSSFIMTVSFTDDGPVGEALLSYGQSGDPGSEHFIDQTWLYREKHWRPVLFERSIIESDTRSRLKLVGARPGADPPPQR